MRTTLAATAAVTALLLLTGCGGTTTAGGTATTATMPPDEPGIPVWDPPPSDVPTSTAPPAPTGPGVYTATGFQGTKIQLTIPATENATATEIDAFRKKNGDKPLTYVTADVDNRPGTRVSQTGRLAIYDADGQQWEFQDASFYATETWNGGGSKKGTSAQYKWLDELGKRNDLTVEVGQRKTVVLATDRKLPAQFARVTIGGEVATFKG